MGRVGRGPHRFLTVWAAHVFGPHGQKSVWVTAHTVPAPMMVNSIIGKGKKGEWKRGGGEERGRRNNPLTAIPGSAPD